MATLEWLEDSMEIDHGESLQFQAMENVSARTRLDRSFGTACSHDDGREEFPTEQNYNDRDFANASFDMSLLQHLHPPTPSGEKSALPLNPMVLRPTASWDEHAIASAEKRARSNQHKPILHHRAHFALDLPELPPMGEGSFRRRLVSSSTFALPPHQRTKSTPASAAKRHRMRPRSSPLPLKVPLTPRAALDTSTADAHASGIKCDLYEPATVVKKRKPKRSLGTCTTTASTTTLEEMTMDHSTDQSVDTHDTNFRFTSFPASLPRIHQTNTAVNGPHATVRKRMSFGSTTAASNFLATGPNDSQNTSVSSLYQDFFSDDEGGDQDDESTIQSSILGTPRARLNFNLLVSTPLAGADGKPLHDTFLGEELDDDYDVHFDGSRPSEHQRKNSSTSSIASSVAKNMSGWCDDQNVTSSTAAMTPSRRVTTEPAPHEIQLHFQLDAAQCSPIPGIPEEEGDSSSKSDCFPRKAKLRLSTSHESATTSSSSAGRPMPDMAAFDGNQANDTSRSSVSTRSGGEDGPPSPRLLCPPTPVRIHPIFRDSHGQKLSRSNSLIATKVLATCSPKFFNEKVVLENPIFDECKYDPLSNESRGRTNVQLSSSKAVNGGWLQQTHHPTVPSEVREISMSVTEKATTPVISMAASFDVISTLGRGTFADVYKVKSKLDGRLYAIKRNRRQFRGRRDREAALSEVRSMQRLQSQAATTFQDCEQVNYSLYVLSFYQAWQEDGHFFCQTELCCRDTCREMMDSLRSDWNRARIMYPSLLRLPAPNAVAGSASDVQGRMVPECVIWKVCHDVATGLSFLHSQSVGLVHNDIKPSNVLLVKHDKFGALCKIGDFGMARSIGSSEDGQEGDQKYMSLEMLETGTSRPAADVFSLGLTLYEMASSLDFAVPADGNHWHELRKSPRTLEFPTERSTELVNLIRTMLDPDPEKRPHAESLLLIRNAIDAGRNDSHFLRHYIHDVEEREKQEEERCGTLHDEQTPRNVPRVLRSPPLTRNLPAPPL